MVAKKLLQGALALTSVAVLAGCAQMGGGHITKGNSPSDARGGAAGSSSVNANSSLERCDAPLGTIAMDDGRDKDWYDAFGSATKVTTIEPLLRLAVQQSNCFVITSIGNSRTEARLAAITDKQRNSGEFRAGSKQHKGQRVAADYLMEPAIIIDNDSTGKVAGGLAGFSRTPEGKATVAAFMDAYNNMVISLRNYKAQQVKGGLGRGGVLKVGD